MKYNALSTHKSVIIHSPATVMNSSTLNSIKVFAILYDILAAIHMNLREDDVNQQ